MTDADDTRRGADDGPFALWEEGLLSAREAVRQLVETEYLPADAAYKAAEQRKKAVRGQLEHLIRSVGESMTCLGLELSWREGSLNVAYPAQRVDWAVRTLHDLLAQLLACPQVPLVEAPPQAELPLQLEATYLVPHALLRELTATVEHLANGREERPRAGALYINREEGVRGRERRGEQHKE
jgi:hypothetical protein